MLSLHPRTIDLLLWELLAITLVVLALANFVHFTKLDAFIDFKSTSITFGFVNIAREKELLQFAYGAKVTDSEIDQIAIDKYLLGIHALSRISRISIEAISFGDSNSRLCLWPGDYYAQTGSHDGGVQRIYFSVETDDFSCLQIRLPESFLLFPNELEVTGKQDSNELLTYYPDLDGKLIINGTTIELDLVNGMEFSLNFLDENPVVIESREGMLRIHTSRDIHFSRGSGKDSTPFYYTPLDILQNYMRNNSLWYSVSLLIGAIFTLRKILALR